MTVGTKMSGGSLKQSSTSSRQTKSPFRRKYTKDDRCAFCGTEQGSYTFIGYPVSHVVCHPCIERAFEQVMEDQDKHRPPAVLP